MTSEDSYYDHYKDTFIHLKGYLKKRDTYTIYLFVMIMIQAFQIKDPEVSVKAANVLIDTKVKGLLIDFRYIESVLLYAFLWVAILYYQINLLIEKMYKYVHNIEKEISKNGNFKVEREGVNYLKNYPWLSEVVHLIYVVLFPCLIIFVMNWKLYSLSKGTGDFRIINSIAILLIILTSILYLSHRHMRERYLSKKYKNSSWKRRIFAYLNLDCR